MSYISPGMHKSILPSSCILFNFITKKNWIKCPFVHKPSLIAPLFEYIRYSFSPNSHTLKNCLFQRKACILPEFHLVSFRDYKLRKFTMVQQFSMLAYNSQFSAWSFSSSFYSLPILPLPFINSMDLFV